MDTSMGGVLTWLRSEAHPDFMDAFAPVCSPPPVTDTCASSAGAGQVRLRLRNSFRTKLPIRLPRLRKDRHAPVSTK